MNPTLHPPLTRKDIARMTGRSIYQVEQHDKEWGLEPLPTNTREILYAYTKTIITLRKLGLIDPD